MGSRPWRSLIIGKRQKKKASTAYQRGAEHIRMGSRPGRSLSIRRSLEEQASTA